MSNLNLLKKAIKNDISHSFGSGRKNELLQLVLNKPLNATSYDKLSKFFAGTKQITEVHIIDYVTRTDFSVKELFDLLIKELPKLKCINITVENLLERQNLLSYESAIDSAVKTGFGLSLTIPFFGKIDLKNQFDEILSEVIKKDFRHVLSKGISLRCLFVITQENCLFADDMLLFCEATGISHYLFMLSEDSKPSDFNGLEQFHTAQFFKKLAKFNSPDFAYSKYYNDLFLVFSKPTSKNVYREKIVLNTIDQNGNKIDSPTYDLNFSPTLGVSELTQRGVKKINGIIRRKVRPVKPTNFDTGVITTPKNSKPKDWKQVLITGWYGTETAGDKAILGEILHFVKSCSPDCKIILTTIFDHVSLQTNLELDDLKGVQLVDIKEGHLPAWIEKADAVIMGGGPLMESQSMIDVWRIFKEANRQEKARIVFGCGVGPIHTEEIKEVTISILKMTTAGFVRDEESYHYAGRLFKGHVLKFACDPAVGFVHRWRKERLTGDKSGTTNRIAGLVRENTNEFVPNQSKSALFEFNTTIAKKLAGILEPACTNNQLQADLLHMNAPWVGGDDRIFNRILEQTFTDPSLIRTERKYLTLEELIGTLHTAKASMAMRYHGHIFSMALGIPFLSIDYTGKQGKVQSLVERIGYDQWSEKWENIDSDRATKKMNTLIDERAHWSNYLLTQTDKLVNLLHNTYEEVFHVEVNELSK